MLARVIFLLIFISTISFTYAQTSLWKDQDVFSNPTKAGDIIRISVDEAFKVTVRSEASKEGKKSISSKPGVEQLNFIPTINLDNSFSNKRSGKVRNRDRVQFVMSAVVGGVVSPNTFRINATRQIQIQDITYQIQLNGVFNSKDVELSVLSSHKIANLQIQFVAQTQPDRDGRIGLRSDEEVSETANPKAQLSDRDRQRLILEALQKALGGQP